MPKMTEGRKQGLRYVVAVYTDALLEEPYGTTFAELLWREQKQALSRLDRGKPHPLHVGGQR